MNVLEIQLSGFDRGYSFLLRRAFRVVVFPLQVVLVTVQHVADVDRATLNKFVYAVKLLHRLQRRTQNSLIGVI